MRGDAHDAETLQTWWKVNMVHRTFDNPVVQLLMEGEQILFVAIYYMYHRRFYHIFTLKYVQIDTFETSIYIRLYYIYIQIVPTNVLHL